MALILTVCKQTSNRSFIERIQISISHQIHNEFDGRRNELFIQTDIFQ
jgi:hypothetical protein